MHKKDVLKLVQDFLKKNPNGVLEILGPTASGKTGFAIEMALTLPDLIGKKAEIISADSRQVYVGCDVSSAKVTVDEMQGIPHHGLDLVELSEEYNVVLFKGYAEQKIREIQQRGNIPILCGGTMLWLDAVSEGYVFSDDKSENAFFDKSTEKIGAEWTFLKLGLNWSREKLYERINQRAHLQFDGGMIEETKDILERYCSSSESLVTLGGETRLLSRSAWTSFGYQEIKAYLEGLCTRDEAIAKNQQRNRNYAKRQLTWWRGREDVTWIDMG